METLQSTIFIEFDVNTKKITFLRGDNIVDYDSNVTSVYVRVKYKNLSGNTVYLTPSELEDYKFSLYTIKPATSNVNVITGEVTDELKENVYGGIVKFEIPRACTNRLGIVKCEIHINQGNKVIGSSTFVLDVQQSLVTAFDDELLGDEDFPVLKQLILEIQKDSNIDDNHRSKITTYSSDKIEDIKKNLDAQIKEKANLSEVRKKDVNITLNDCNAEMLAAIQNKEGETTFNLLSIPQDNSIDHTKFKDRDFFTIDSDWETLSRKSDSTGNWANNILYKKGFVKTIKIGINSDTDETGKVLLYKRFENGDIQVDKSYEFKGHGIVTIVIDRYIEYDFYLSTKCPNVRYDASTTMTSSMLGRRTDKFTPSFEFNYCFAVGVEYANLYDSLDKTLLNINKNLLKSSSALPVNGEVDYPITFDFTTNTLSISNMYILDTSNSVQHRPRYYVQNKTLAIKDLPEEGYYVIYLLFDVNTKEISLAYSNGESEVLDLEIFDNKLIICYGLTNGKTYFSFGNINSNYVKAIVKNIKNVDETNADDIIIPKYAEKKIITVLQQKNRWFDKKANIIGDSIIKGENSADSYKRMKDDNVASILMEEFGFKEVRNYGIGESRITTHSDANFAKKGMVDRYIDMSDDSDLNIVSGGTNDFGNSVQLGDLSDLTDNTKFKPALYNLLKGMQNKYPGKELYFITPAHRKDGKPENVANSAGLILKDYVEAAYEVCELLSVPVIDMWKELGFSPFNDTMKNTYMKDGLHPTIEGMRKYYGAKICKEIR